jgi:predicted MFS family arabinose efflux permease
MATAAPPSLTRERLIVFLVGAVQFVNILDFVMVMPLGPDFADALHFPRRQIGWIGGAYTGAAAIAGIAGAFFLDRFDRRRALALAMTGLVSGTALGGLATSLHTLLAARLVAGMFGGPATSIALAIIADTVPIERRGRAMGAVMGAFSAASVIGVPIGLKLARLGGWQMPFFGTAGLGVVVGALVISILPPMRGHLETRSTEPVWDRLRRLLSRRIVQLSYLMTATVMAGGFVIIPMLSPYVQGNLAYPRDHLDRLYLYGGIVSFFTTRFGGRAVDRFGSLNVSIAAVTILLMVQATFLVMGWVPWGSVPLVFMAFMFGMGLRNVAQQTLASQVPDAAERAGFASLQSVVGHAAAATATIAAGLIVAETADGALVHVERLGMVAMSLTFLAPFFVGMVQARLRARVAEARQ